MLPQGVFYGEHGHSIYGSKGQMPNFEGNEDILGNRKT